MPMPNGLKLCCYEPWNPWQLKTWWLHWCRRLQLKTRVRSLRSGEIWSNDEILYNARYISISAFQYDETCGSVWFGLLAAKCHGCRQTPMTKHHQKTIYQGLRDQDLWDQQFLGWWCHRPFLIQQQALRSDLVIQQHHQGKNPCWSHDSPPVNPPWWPRRPKLPKRAQRQDQAGVMRLPGEKSMAAVSHRFRKALPLCSAWLPCATRTESHKVSKKCLHVHVRCGWSYTQGPRLQRKLSEWINWGLHFHWH